nr:Tetratricopeptide helical [Hymenolepis microstoma]
MSPLTVDMIHIRNFQAYYDDTTKTDTKETDEMLYYKTQNFYCKVGIELPTCIADRDWSVGLVQACDYMHLENNYGGLGKSLWEFHPLKSGLRQFINDSDGRQYPFYSISQSLYSIKKGNVKRALVNLQIKDYFHPSVVWTLPYSRGVHLTEIGRNQRFYIWLVAIKHGRKACGQEDEVHILQKLRWEYDLHMEIDPYMPVGQKVRRIYDTQGDSIAMCDFNPSQKLPIEATHAPHCNAAQSLIWYPRDQTRHSRILVPPKQIIVPWEKWVSDMLGPSARSLFQMAEVLYRNSDFEGALVYFHRGKQIQPNSSAFGLGVIKSEDAIYALTGDRLRSKFNSFYGAIQDNSTLLEIQTNEPSSQAQNNPPETERNFKHLMGKSFDSVQHFNKLAQEEGQYEKYLKNSKEIREISNEIYQYLEGRSEFWQQLDATLVHPKRRYKKKAKRKTNMIDQLSILQKIVQLLQDVSDVQHAGDHEKALCLCSALRNDLKQLNSNFPELNEILADLNAFEGVSYYHLYNFKEAQKAFNNQLKICESSKLQSQLPRSLENLGRTYTKLRNYRAAKDIWLERFKYDSDNQDKMWLQFEIAFCCFELSEYEESIARSLAAKQLAETTHNMNWELKASILVAQSNLALKNLCEAQIYLQSAQYAAYILDQHDLGALLAKAIDLVDEEIDEANYKAVKEKCRSLSTAQIQNFENSSVDSNDDSSKALFSCLCRCISSRNSKNKRLGYGYHRGCFRALLDQVPYLRRPPGPSFVEAY